MKPMVAVVGRPNVGKSTFFNRVCRERRSIVKDNPGVTRDRLLSDAEWSGREFTLIDTGGIETGSDDPMQSHIREQARIAIEMADVIVFMVDGKQGLVASDYEVAAILRTSGKPVVLAVNKLDNFDPTLIYEFYELAIGDPIGVSSEAGIGIGDLLDEVVKNLPPQSKNETVSSDAIKIAIVGRPNAGKSSLVNRLLGETRVIVTDIAGTTRDTVDSPVCVDGDDYVIIDTAGLRRKRGVESHSVEAISALMALKAIERADVVLIVLDATSGVNEQDVRIAGYVNEAGKPSIVVLNKWDLVEKDTYTVNRFNKELDEKLKFMDYFDTAFVSAVTGQRAMKLLEQSKKCYANSRRRISTGVLNEIISNAVASTEPPASSGRRLKIYYSTQASVAPPTFVLFVNDQTLMHFSYLRYLENELRAAVDFSGTPIRIEIREKTDSD